MVISVLPVITDMPSILIIPTTYLWFSMTLAVILVMMGILVMARNPHNTLGSTVVHSRHFRHLAIVITMTFSSFQR